MTGGLMEGCACPQPAAGTPSQVLGADPQEGEELGPTPQPWSSRLDWNLKQAQALDFLAGRVLHSQPCFGILQTQMSLQETIQSLKLTNQELLKRGSGNTQQVATCDTACKVWRPASPARLWPGPGSHPTFEWSPLLPQN